MRNLQIAIALAIFCHPVLASDAPTTTTENVRAQTIRIGHFPNITHAQALIAHQLSRSGDGWFERRLGHQVNIQWYVYDAGPAAMEAIFAGSIDLTYVGPSPAVNAYVQSNGNEIRVISGAVTGGAALVVQSDEAKVLVRAELTAEIRHDFPPRIIERSWPRLRFTANLIAGLEKPGRGRVLADGKPVSADRMMMFQESALFPWLDVMGNVLFGLKLKPGLSRSERKEVAEFHLGLVGLEKFMHANIHELSGGMKQRVALARALAPNPKVLLMDEPFPALDALTREQLYDDIQRIWRERQKTIVLVTHNVREAACLGDRVLVFAKHPGRVAHEFTVGLDRPRDGAR